MALTPNKNDPSPTYVETVEEIMKSYKSLPPRPSIEEVEAAMSVVKTVNYEEQERLEEISKEVAPQDVPPELFSVLQEVRKSKVLFRSHEQMKEAVHLVELDKIFQTFDELIQRASELVSAKTSPEKELNLGGPDGEIGIEVVISDDESVRRNEEPKIEDSKGMSLNASSEPPSIPSAAKYEESKQLSLMRVAAIIESSAKAEAEFLDLQGKLMDKIEWLPLSLGKLSHIIELNIADNNLMVLPSTIGSLKSLRKLDVHSNQLFNLPDSFGELLGLTDLDLHANRLRSLPASFKNLKDLISLDLSSNRFAHLPDAIGNLTSLKKLSVQLNELEELPYTIGSCLLLVELRLDFNQLKALPLSISKLQYLEILTLHYNRIKVLPTMGNLLHLKELDVSFNELESIPESLCHAVSLKKLNVGKNFSDLRALPKSIGNLELLEELDISDNQIFVLPDSFRFLANLKVFHADQTPLELPPTEIAKLGAEAVVNFMAEFVTTRDMRPQRPVKQRGFCLQFFVNCFRVETA
ncbi:uncharacterized protein [Coffea arabica]|uniref:Disease resistance R13L4/SHOC-2-like LRR domain-containing protein n=1 Tax=Coffea arabica TaxID=13443 RepID=A0A6P6TRJ6_COFAR|nr:plant intracellular Ras-group-related LRR protein 5-like [Coffea arabica]